VEAEKLHIIDKDCIEKGIVELICKHNIKKLMMGAASDKYHSRRMTDLRSRKAIYDLYLLDNLKSNHSSAFLHNRFLLRPTAVGDEVGQSYAQQNGATEANGMTDERLVGEQIED
ncbi:hypothetical protein HN873_015866, partial [Arachis hypogaea]